ncbi:MAG: fused gamma-glutamyl-gamma-aminobutyrate hydrolase/peptidase [Bacteroidales bacterium]|nr:MAG: fused gamma-glutamyl-gamma-aminobutyrate hydrolase/peptidase [Bacteroidales bacterium]
MAVLIGISANYDDLHRSTLVENYYQSVLAVGGVPIIIPVVNDLAMLDFIVEKLDGIILSGGGDLNSKYFGQEPIAESGESCDFRDEYDLSLVRLAKDYQVPILGICRGMQVLNIAFGGDIYQDIKTQYYGNPLDHSQKEARYIPTQRVKIHFDSLLYSIVKEEHLSVNSIHHQAVCNIAKGFRTVAFAEDGLCEAIEAISYPMIGVQWHPEHLSGISFGQEEGRVEDKDIYMPHLNLFRWLVCEAEIHQKAKNIHRRTFVVDSHCDTPMFFAYPEVNVVDNDKIFVSPSDVDMEGNEPVCYEVKVDAKKMKQGKVDAVFEVAYIPQGNLDLLSHQKATQKAIDIINKVSKQILSSGRKVVLGRSYKDLEKAKTTDTPTIFFGIENGYALGNDIDNIQCFYDMGVRYITLCHNGDNLICDSAMSSKQKNDGLSDFGKTVVCKLNELGVLIDISHAGEKSFWDIIATSSKPVVATHSCCRALRNHPRNLTDEQIKAIADGGGVVQVCLYKHFLADVGQEASITHAVEHIKHIKSLVGVDYVGVGSDFDGGGEILGCVAENEIINITKALIKEGFEEEDISKILGGNFMRVFKEVCG